MSRFLKNWTTTRGYRRTRLGEFCLCILQPVKQRPILPKHQRSSYIASDRGVRTFMTGYDPTFGHVFEFAQDDHKRLVRLALRCDKLYSKKIAIEQMNHRRRYSLRRACLRCIERSAILRMKCTKNSPLLLCSNFETTLLPKFETQKMSRRLARKINSKVVRSMLTWSHYRFQQRLIYKVSEFSGCKVLIIDEDYTSKTCLSAGQ